MEVQHVCISKILLATMGLQSPGMKISNQVGGWLFMWFKVVEKKRSWISFYKDFQYYNIGYAVNDLQTLNFGTRDLSAVGG